MIRELFAKSKWPRRATDRAAALAKARTDRQAARDKELAELVAQQKRVTDACTASIAGDASEIEAMTDALDAELAADIKASVYPLLAGFGGDPRGTARRLIEVWRELARRAVDDIGAEIDIRHVGLALLATMPGDVLLWAAHPERTHGLPGTSTIVAAVSSEQPARVEHALREVEASLARRATGFSVDGEARATLERRLSLMQARATVKRSVDALAFFDAAEAKAKRLAREAADAPRRAKFAEQQKALEEKAILHRQQQPQLEAAHQRTAGVAEARRLGFG